MRTGWTKSINLRGFQRGFSEGDFSCVSRKGRCSFRGGGLKGSFTGGDLGRPTKKGAIRGSRKVGHFSGLGGKSMSGMKL